jgi:putative DNA primase/helicase
MATAPKRYPRADVKQLENIPPELRATSQWECWMMAKQDGKFRKVPMNAVTLTAYPKGKTNSDAMATATYDQAIAYFKAKGSLLGIGFRFKPQDPFNGADFDNCRNPETRAVDPWVEEIIRSFASYSEVSQSGTGIKIIWRGPAVETLTKTPIGHTFYGDEPVSVEIYSTGRYFALTGNIFNGTKKITEAHQAYVGLIQKLEPYSKKPKAKSREAQDVRDKITAGERNPTLFSKAVELRKKAQLTQPEIEAALLKFNELRCDPPKPENEVLDIARRVSDEKYAPEVGEVSHHGTTPANDAANVRRFAHQHSLNVRYLADLKTWRCWNGKYWQPDDATGAPMCCALATAASIFDEAKQLTGEDQENRAKWAVRSGDRNRLDAMIAVARGVPAIRVRHYGDTFDHRPDLLTCNNGIVDLRTGALLPFQQDLMLTQMAMVNFNPEATCPNYDQFISDAFEHDQEIVEYFDRVMGYCITGHTKERAFFLLLGDGRNGKTTIAELLKKILGSAAHKADFATFVRASYQKSGSDAAPDIIILADKRFVWAVETEGKRKLDTARLKEHSGEDSITARGLRKDPVTFKPQYKIFLVANESPEISGDPALFDRLHYLDFNYRIPDEKLVGDFLNTVLVPELEGIFARWVRGAMAWHRQGLKPPASVLQAKQEDIIKDALPVEEWFERWFGEHVFRTTGSEGLALVDLMFDLKEWASHVEGGVPVELGRRALSGWLQRKEKLEVSPQKINGKRHVFMNVAFKTITKNPKNRR